MGYYSFGDLLKNLWHFEIFLRTGLYMVLELSKCYASCTFKSFDLSQTLWGHGKNRLLLFWRYTKYQNFYGTIICLLTRDPSWGFQKPRLVSCALRESFWGYGLIRLDTGYYFPCQFTMFKKYMALLNFSIWVNEKITKPGFYWAKRMIIWDFES